jgi:urea ABC transporter ATP-binding protein UrtE
MCIWGEIFVLRVEGLRSGYGRTPVLLGVDLEVEAGEVVAVLGRNGAGKSTLLKTLAGLLPATEGRILIDGQEITRLPAHRRCRMGIAYVPQGREVFPRLSVIDNVRVAAGTRPNAEARIHAALAEWPGLAAKRNAWGQALSGGQQQQLAIARALVSEPRILLLDEPTEGIQPSVVRELQAHIKDLSERKQLAVLLVEQNLDFATGLASRVCIMVKGEIRERLPVSEIAGNQELLREYLGV